MGTRIRSGYLRAIALAGVVYFSPTANAVLWINAAGGSFHTGSNWNTGAPPNSSENALFDLNDPAYIVSMTSSVTNLSIQVHNDRVRLNLGSPVIYTLNSTESILVGFSSGDDARLTLSSGTINSNTGRIGAAGTTAELFVENNTTWNNSNDIIVGSGGTGHLEITGGADVITGGLRLGNGTTGVGTARLFGGTLDPGGLTIGNDGTGSLSIESGTLIGSAATIGSAETGDGTLTVSGSGRWNLTSNAVTVGLHGSGNVIVQNGGIINGSAINMANFSTASGSITVTGAGSAWYNPFGVSIGIAGSGSVTVSSGGQITSNTATIGGGATGNATVLVTGTSSLWDIATTMTLGSSGVGSLTIQNGAKVEAQNVNVGTSLGSRGTLSLVGASSNLTALGSMYVGGSSSGPGGTATFSVNTGTTASIAGTLKHWPAGTINLSGGTLSVGTLEDGGGIFNFSSGTLNLTNSVLNVGSGALGSTVQLAANQSVSATGVAVELGGLLILNGATIAATSATQNFTNNGEIQLNGATSLINGRPLINNGLLMGNGRVASASSTNSASGEIRVSGADRVLFTGTATNAGQINVFNGGTVEFGSALTNQASGRINGRGILISRGTLTNQGQMNFSEGVSDVFANINNASGGKIIVTGRGVTTFYNPITNNAGADIRASVGSMAVFIGNVTGAGTFSGGGIKVFEATGTVIGPVETPGSTIVETPASVTASYFREDSLTVNGLVTIATGGGTSHLNALNIDPEAVLDLKNNSLVLEGGDLAVITSQIRSGLYEGSGIISSAPGSPFRLGSMSNTGTFYSNFQGISGLDGDEVLIRYTRIGDLNLDGTVSISDFIDLAAHFNTIGGATWQMGDVNYDSSVTISDFIDLASNFNQSVSGATIQISQEEQAMIDNFAASAVPEPASLAILASAFSLLRRRRLA